MRDKNLTKYKRNEIWIYNFIYEKFSIKTQKPFHSKESQCCCDECWKVSEEYKKIHFGIYRSYNRFPNDWLFYKYDKIKYYKLNVKRITLKFNPKKTARMEKFGLY